jgi:hypothetical protein
MSDITAQTSSSNDQNMDPEALGFIRDLVIAKTGIDYDQLSEEDKTNVGLEIFDDYVTFVDQAVNDLGREDELKHWNMYKASGLSPKLLETLPTLATTVSELTKAYINL